MSEQENSVPVTIIFRKLRPTMGGQIIALFPYEIAVGYSVLSYMHIGQHSAADYTHIVRSSSLATEEEYKDLKEELESVGYEIDVQKKRNYAKYLEAYYNTITACVVDCSTPPPEPILLPTIEEGESYIRNYKSKK